MRKLLTLLFFLGLILCCLPSPASAEARIAPAATTAPLVTTAPVNTLHFIPVSTTTATPQTGVVTISSSPSGATVVIDGTAMGTTPFSTRTLNTGSHTLVLQKNGYLDYTSPFTILPDNLNQQSYTLTPAPVSAIAQADTIRTTVMETPVPTTMMPLTTASLPPVTQVTPRPIAVPQVPARSLAEQLQALGPVTIQPVTIRVGSHTKTPILTTLSPYFSYQFNTQNVTAPSGYHTPSVPVFPLSYIEVDSANTYLPTSRLMSNAEVAISPVWGDEDTVYIRDTATFYNNSNFRWLSLDKDATAFYQVSRYPFSDNATAWQNQYVPGLVASGPATDVFVDSEGFHYFRLNFARIANHDPSDPPYYTGISHLDPTVPGQGKPMGLVKFPFTSSGLWYKKSGIGPVMVPVPDSFAQIPAGAYAEQDLGNPNENMILSEDTAPLFSHDSSAFASVIADLDRTYYVRIVPIGKNGNAGVPAIPVTVTVRRPHPCPSQGPTNVQENIIIRPPSSQVVSFYMTLLVPDWVHTDQNGALVSRAHFVTVATPPACLAPVTGNSMMNDLNTQLCSMYGGSQPGYHFYADPAESHWYDTVWDIIKGLFMALTTVANSVSAAWNQINNLVVQIAAYAVQGLTFGAFDCNSSPACTGLLHAGLALAESSLGIPPTIPNAADLENMGADYMAKVAADQIGAGGALDAAQSAYSAMPDSAKQAIKDNAADIGTNMGDAIGSQSSAAVAGAAGNFYIPDPLYYQSHPATLVVKVTNPNGQATDPFTLSVKDTGGFYHASSVPVPSLKPYDSTLIPFVLTEDFSKGYTSSCNNQQWTTTNGIPCYWENWQQAARAYGTDQFVTSYSVKKNGQWISGITPSSSGTVLSSQNVIAVDEEGKTCPGYTSTQVLQFPVGWQMQQKSLSQDFNSVMWNVYTFTEGARGRMIGS